LVGAPLHQRLRRRQGQRDQQARKEIRARQAQPEVRAETPTVAVRTTKSARKMISAMRNENRQNTKESRMPETGIATIQVAQLASMSTRMPKEE
jgi:hypothetical protein